MKTNFFKKSLLLTVASVFGIVASAQNLSIEPTIGIGFSGYNIENTLDINGVGFRVGAIGEISIPQVQGLYANTGLLLSLEGAKMDMFGATASWNPYFLDIPIHVGYSYNIIDKLSVFAEFGPYVGVGLFGNIKATDGGLGDWDEEIEVEKTPIFDEDYSTMKRMQFGLGIKVGLVALGHYKLSFGWDWNLLNAATEYSGETIKHNNGYLAISYVF